MISRLKEVIIEEIPDITSDIIEKLKKLNINSVYQLAVQNPTELALKFEDTSLNVESASTLIANARKILIDNEVLSREFLSADDLLEKRNKLSRYATGSESFDNLMNGGFESQAITNECGNYWFPINVICSNLGSQIQGDENSVTLSAAAADNEEKENPDESSQSFTPFP